MPLRHIALAIITALIWGVNFSFSKMVLAHFPTYLLLATRMVIVAVILLPFVKRPTVPLKTLFAVSFVFTVLHFGFMFQGLKLGLDVSIAVTVDQLRVPFALILGVIFFKEKPGWRSVLGIGIAIVGTLFLVGAPNAFNHMTGFLMMIAGAWAWAVYNIQIKRMETVNILAFMAWVALFSIPQLLLLSLIFESNHVEVLTTVTPAIVGSMLYIAIGSTILAHGGWYYLLCRYPVSQVVPYSLLVPVFGILSAIIGLGEKLSWEVTVGSILTITGVAIIVWRRPQAARAGEAT